MHDEATVAKTAGTPASAPDPTGTVLSTLNDNLTCNGNLVPGGISLNEPVERHGRHGTRDRRARRVFLRRSYNGDSNYPPAGRRPRDGDGHDERRPPLPLASATRTAKGVLVRWRTGTEAELLGFQVYRSRGHSWKRLTRSLIVAKGSVAGASYRFLDQTARRGVAYRYRIKAVNRDGTTSWSARCA